jgi:hypothetical protein
MAGESTTRFRKDERRGLQARVPNAIRAREDWRSARHRAAQGRCDARVVDDQACLPAGASPNRPLTVTSLTLGWRP